VLIGYQDNGSSNNGVSYVLDLSTETLKSIAGIAKEAGVESNVIDVVTQGECDFLSGLTPGSYYYSSGTGFLSASAGDYEVGVAKSATNLLLNAVIPKVDEEKIAFIDRLVANSMTPSIEQALLYDFWKTREVKTSSGTFTVPSNVYAVGIFCLGAGANGTTSFGGGGGGLSMKIKRVVPGDQIPYTIAVGVATCDGMTANPASGTTGGTASGGMYNYSGGSTQNTAYIGGAGCGGNTLGSQCVGGGSMRHWGQTSAPSISNSSSFFGGHGMYLTQGVLDGIASPSQNIYGGCGFGTLGGVDPTNSFITGGIGRQPQQLGIFVTSDITGNNNSLNVSNVSSSTNSALKAGDWNGGAYANNNTGSGTQYAGDGGLGGGGGMGQGNAACEPGNGGLGGGGGASYALSRPGNGGLGGGGGGTPNSQTGGNGGYGGGGGSGATLGGAGGSSVVIFVF
jgi:hypothetical protein